MSDGSPASVPHGPIRGNVPTYGAEAFPSTYGISSAIYHGHGSARRTDTPVRTTTTLYMQERVVVAMTPDDTPGAGSASSYLRAQFRIQPDPEGGCAVVDSGERGRNVTQRVVDPGGDCGEECRAEVSTDGDHRFLDGDVSAGCICPTFTEYDCIASVEGFDGEELLVSVATPDREELTAIVAALREAGAVVRLQRITRAGEREDDRILELATDAITEKQRETVELAIERGYYERPRRIDLGELAAELGISKSAVSQRLTTVEAKLVGELAEATDGGR